MNKDKYECTAMIARECIKKGEFPACGSPSIVEQISTRIDAFTFGIPALGIDPPGEISIYARY